MREAVRCAIIVLACSSQPRSSTAPAVSMAGRTSEGSGAAAKTKANNQPRKAKRAMPNAEAKRLMSTAAAIRPRPPRVIRQSRLSKYISLPFPGREKGGILAPDERPRQALGDAWHACILRRRLGGCCRHEFGDQTKRCGARRNRTGRLRGARAVPLGARQHGGVRAAGASRSEGGGASQCRRALVQIGRASC